MSYCILPAISLVPRPLEVAQFDAQWNRLQPRPVRLTATDAGGAVYGEYTSGSIFRIFKALQYLAQLKPTDIILDWGAGSLKFLVALNSFSGCVCLGIEKDSSVYLAAQGVLSRAYIGELTVGVHNDDSSTFRTFEPADVVVQFEGGTTQQLNKTHRKIMRRVFRSSTVRAVVSSKLNISLFRKYFPSMQPVTGVNWRCTRISDGLSHGGGSYGTHIWIRQVPVFSPTPFVDPRMIDLLTSTVKPL
jgi:hypothetical protein